MLLDGKVIGTSNPVMKSVTQPGLTVWADRQRTRRGRTCWWLSTGCAAGPGS